MFSHYKSKEFQDMKGEQKKWHKEHMERPDKGAHNHTHEWVILKVTRFKTSSAYSECTFLFSHLANLTQAATSEAD